MDKRIEKIMVLFIVLFGLLNVYLIIKSAGCGVCIYRTYQELMYSLSTLVRV